MYRIFLVEDDAPLAAAIKARLEAYGNAVITASDFSDVISEFQSAQPDLVLMDIMLPVQDGYYFCREIRKISKVPVVFLSSASENMNIVMAISMGGDDFIAKPVDPMVLCAKVSAVLRRTYEMNAEQHIIVFGDACLSLSDQTVSMKTAAGEEKAQLTKHEFLIFRTLLESRGNIVSRDALMLKLWQDNCFVEENTLSVNVARLRKKLEGIGLSDVILTRQGQGYTVL